MAHPGPVDDSVLYLQDQHRSSAVFDGQDLLPLHCTQHTVQTGVWEVTHPRMVQLLQLSGFYSASRIRWFPLDHSLITSLVERWRPETWSFHMRWGEATITLQDVAILLGLRVDGPAVISHQEVGALCRWHTWGDAYEALLGVAPPQEAKKGNSVKLSWLRSTFGNGPAGDDIPDEHIILHTRAYILHLIGTMLFPDASGYTVSPIYLPLLEDLEECGTRAWGAAVLAYLYRELNKACAPDKLEIAGCISLLQMWSWEHLYIGRPDVVPAYMGDGPLGCRYNGIRMHPSSKRVLSFYRDELDKLDSDQFIWMPYTPVVMAALPEICLDGSFVWRARTVLISFEIIEMHLPDRVLQQFGLIQHIPDSVGERPTLVGRRGRDEDWLNRHRPYVDRWDARDEAIIFERPYDSAVEAKIQYQEWYLRITRRYISRHPPQNANVIDYQPQGHAQRELVDTIFGVSDIAHSCDDSYEVRDLRRAMQRVCRIVDDAIQSHRLARTPAVSLDLPLSPSSSERGSPLDDDPGDSIPSPELASTPPKQTSGIDILRVSQHRRRRRVDRSGASTSAAAPPPQRGRR